MHTVFETVPTTLAGLRAKIDFAGSVDVERVYLRSYRDCQSKVEGYVPDFTAQASMNRAT
jgi:hypothetical protein